MIRLLRWNRNRLSELQITVYMAKLQNVRFVIRYFSPRLPVDLDLQIKTAVCVGGVWTHGWDKKLSCQCSTVKEAKARAEEWVAAHCNV